MSVKRSDLSGWLCGYMRLGPAWGLVCAPQMSAIVTVVAALRLSPLAFQVSSPSGPHPGTLSTAPLPSAVLCVCQAPAIPPVPSFRLHPRFLRPARERMMALYPFNGRGTWAPCPEVQRGREMGRCQLWECRERSS